MRTSEQTTIVQVSGPCLCETCHACDADYVTSVCKGRCCEGSKRGEIHVSVHDSEWSRLHRLGATIVDGFIVADHRGLCPFKTAYGRCAVHSIAQPLGCRASPFALNKSDLLVFRNRNRRLRCYKCAGSLPAYRAHMYSLLSIFDKHEYDLIVTAAENGEQRIDALMRTPIYEILASTRDKLSARFSRR